MLNWKCANCQTRINPLKRWAKIDKFIKCYSCQQLNTIDRNNVYAPGVGSLGVLIGMAMKNHFQISSLLVLAIFVPACVLLDLVFLKIRKVGKIEAASYTGTP